MEIGLFGAILLALDIYAIYNILHEKWSGGKKVLWMVLVLAFPLVGMIIYFVFFRENRPD
ncbi:MAG: PLD nuclease N-terminal domain-containing protein [Rickettsiales bacterium]